MMQTMFTPGAEDKKAGSAGRMDMFLRSVERQAYTMANYATANPDDALDIVQDAMTAFVRRYRRKPESQWRPLFFRCVDNRIKDWFRRRKVRLRWSVSLNPGPERPDPSATAENLQTPQPDQAVAGMELGSAMQQALNALPDRQRQAFLMRTWQGLSVRETANAMGCSEGSVKTHLSRANQTLKSLLESFYE